MHSERSRQREAGFTLLETLVATSVLAMVLAAVMSTLGWSMRTHTLRMERAWLAELNRSVLETHLQRPDPQATTGSAPPDWHWRIEDMPATREDGTSGLRQVTVEGWSDRRPDLIVTLTTLR